MFTLRVRVKLVLLLVLVLSTLGLNKAKACANQRCIALQKSGQQVGHGCVAGGSYVQCWARVEGCTILYCAD